MNTPTVRQDVAVVIGRWHLVHKGHETLFKAALAAGEKVVIVIGSAFRARDPRNPFTWQERAKMIEATLSPEERKRVVFLPVRDYYNNARWTTAVRQGLEKVVDRPDRAVLIGFKKDWTSEYLNHMGWQLQVVTREHEVDATDMRRVYFESKNMAAAMSVLEPYVSQGVRDYLQAWSSLGEYKTRAAEHAAIVGYREKYNADSYNTADALVQIGDYVLLVKRASIFGRGLWALPGGFVNKNERFLTAAMRELNEETQFPIPEFTLLATLQGSALFDDPLRSPRARLITNAFHFRFGEMAELPEVRGTDDAKEAKWFHINELAAMEPLLFEDHFMILDHFLHIL